MFSYRFYLKYVTFLCGLLKSEVYHLAILGFLS